jgi:RHS repeat-associated protein
VRDERGFGSVKYLYNALGERVSKDPQGKDHEFNQGLTHFIYDTDGNLIAEADSFGGISKEYVLMDGLPIAELEGDDIHYIHTDHLGTPQKMTDADQKVVWSRVAEPFGETLRIDGPATLNIRGRGQYHDSESGLLYNLNRSLDPRSNIYTQSDPTGLLGGINPRIHVGQNPINRVDPSGLDEMAPGTWNWLLNPPSTNGSQCSSSSVSPSYPYPYFTPQNFMDNLLLLGMLVPALGEFAATGEGALDIGIDQKIFNQMDSRGWNSNSIQSTVDDPYATSSALNKATGENATAYYNADGSYVVRDNSTGQIIQISNKNNSNWIPDSSIKNPYKP